MKELYAVAKDIVETTTYYFPVNLLGYTQSNDTHFVNFDCRIDPFVIIRGR